MSQTLTQLQYLDKDLILKGVCEWIVKESPILKVIPQKTIQGNSYKYNVETALPTVSWLTVGDQITENTGTFEQRTTSIYAMIGDADTDKFAIALNSTQDPEAIDIAMKAKAMAHEWENTFIRGQTSTLSTTKQFKGLLRMLAELESATTTDIDGPNNTQCIANSATSAALTMAKVDEMIDAIKPGKPDLLLMGRRARRKLTALQRASGSGVTMIDRADFGLTMPTYDGIPIMASDFVPENLPDGSSSILTIATWNPATAWADGYNNTAIFALQFGEDKVSGLQSGQMTHERETFVEDYNVIRNRFLWYCGAACFRKYSLACLFDIDSSA